MLKKIALTTLMALSLLVTIPHNAKASDAIADLKIANDVLQDVMPLIKIGVKSIKKGLKESIVFIKHLKNYRAHKRHENWHPFWVEKRARKQDSQEIPLVHVSTVRMNVEEEDGF